MIRSQLFLTGLAAVLAIAYPLGTFRAGFSFDEAAHAYGALRTLAGEIPNVDFVGLFTGGTYVTGAALAHVFGPGVLAQRAGTILLAAAIGAAIFRVSARLAPAGWALLASALFGLVGVRYHWLVLSPSWYAALFALVAMLCLERLRTAGGGRWAVATGLACAAGFLFKQNLGILILGGCLLALEAWRVEDHPLESRVTLVAVAGIASSYAWLAGTGVRHVALATPLWALAAAAWRRAEPARDAAGSVEAGDPPDAAPEGTDAKATRLAAPSRALQALVVGAFAVPLCCGLLALGAARGGAGVRLFLYRIFVLPSAVYANAREPLAVWPEPVAVAVLALIAAPLALPARWQRFAPVVPWMVAAAALLPGTRAEVYLTIFCAKAMAWLPLAALAALPFCARPSRGRAVTAVHAVAACFLFVAVPLGIPLYLAYGLAPALPVVVYLAARSTRRRYLAHTLLAIALAHAVFQMRHWIPLPGGTRSELAGIEMDAARAHALDWAIGRVRALPAGDTVLVFPYAFVGLYRAPVDDVGFCGTLVASGAAERARVYAQCVERKAWIMVDATEGPARRGLDVLLSEHYRLVETVPPYSLYAWSR